MDKVPWFSLWWNKRLHTPKDDLVYFIPAQSIQDTEKILYEYGSKKPANEGLVYWGGRRIDNRIAVSLVIAPQTQSNAGRVSTSPCSNFYFVRELNQRGLTQIAQIHSHPGAWIDHSPGDNVLAAFKIEGLLSIVIPQYCQNGIQNLTLCGVHRYTSGAFIRLSNRYIKKHFKITDNAKSDFVDLRL